MLVLLAAVYACIELREVFPRGSDVREALKDWHFSLGLSVFVLVWLRLMLRALFRVSPLVPALPPWQRWPAAAVHALLYALMIGMPLLGWTLLNAEGKPVDIFGLVLPALVASNDALAGRLEELHETVGVIGYWLIGLHAAAALFHHYVLRDATLRRMLPRGTR